MAHLWAETFGCSVWWSFGEIFLGFPIKGLLQMRQSTLGYWAPLEEEKFESWTQKWKPLFLKPWSEGGPFKKKTLAQATSNQQPATSNQQPATSNQQTANSKQQTANSKQQTANSKQQTANSKQQTANSKQGWGSSAKQLSFAKRMSRRRS